MSDPLDVLETFSAVHPGVILREEFIEPFGLSTGRVAEGCGLPEADVESIVSERVGISGDAALRLGRFFDTTAEFWINLQKHYELEQARAALGAEVDRIVPFERAA